MSFRIDEILEKMNSRDGDFRYMAISDFMAEIPKPHFKLDAESEKKIVNKLLEMVVKDGNADVKALAVKCLGPLATHAQESQLQNMIDKLGNNLLNDNMEDEVRDISSIGLKTVIAEVPETQVETINLIINRLASRLVDVIAKDNKPEVIVLCLDLLYDLLTRWGKELGKQKGLYEKIQKAVLPHLQAAQSANRKKAIGCLSYLAVTVPDSLFAELVDHLVKSVESTKKAEYIRTYVQAIGSISRTVGFKLGKYLEKIVPLVFKYAEKYEEDDEIRENCLQALDSIVLRCPKEADKFLVETEKLCIKLITHDPNFVDESEGEGGDDMEVEEEEEYGSDYDYTDDDDMSWKVRKAATRCINSIIKTRPERLNHVYETILPVLVKRFKEREENVKLDVFNAFVEILKSTSNVVHESGAGQSNLNSYIPNIVKALVKELKGKSLKTRPGVFQLLVELVTVNPGCLASHVGSFIPGVESALGEKNTSSALKIEALLFLRALIHNHEPSVFSPHLKKLLPPVFKAVKDRYYKITAEGLRVCCKLVRVLEASESPDYIKQLYDVNFERLKQLDIDQEVKEVAIECGGLILSHLGDKVPAQESLKLLVERLSNEVTRLVTVRAFEQIASHSKVDLEPVLSDVVKLLATFLRQHNRQLKQATLSTLSVVIERCGNLSQTSSHYTTLLKELSEIVHDSDLHLAHLSLSTIAAVVHTHQANENEVLKTNVIPRANALLKSALLQGAALESMLVFFKELVSAHSSLLSYQTLLSGLFSLVSGEQLSKQSYHSIAQCIAVLVAFTSESREATVSKIVKDAQTGAENVRLLSLYCVGEIGRRIDLSGDASVKAVILEALDHPSEEIKSAASVSLGCVAVGNLAKYLPEILSEISSNPKRQYLLLGSLREVIVRLSTTDGKDKLSGYFDELLVLLFKNTASEEEGTRNVVSECLGKLALLNPEKVLATLVQNTSSSEKFTRACATTAIKSSILEKSHPIDAVLPQHISAFLNLLTDKEIVVRKAALLSFNYVAHHKPQIVRDLLPKYLPALYGETVIKAELIREVDVGPFKHKVDQGIELRQAAFETMYTLLDTCLTRLNLVEFIQPLVSGLVDTHDIQMLNHLILVRLARKAGSALLSGLDKLIEPLKAGVTSKPKDQAVQQQVERNEELIRSTLRAIVAISKISDIENSPAFAEFLRTTFAQGPLKEKYELIVKEQIDR
eukprot:TRINITY_DN10328_c0_g1_i1.p1 TRINITY_DN10328_c0_g1~~TRINITY_DN10328_c0_g1_i1.p1  ORF type:complete len:1207 (+),score=380.40 TRINITY_DN10328_c0_g1_i1:38-3658(+)